MRPGEDGGDGGTSSSGTGGGGASHGGTSSKPPASASGGASSGGASTGTGGASAGSPGLAGSAAGPGGPSTSMLDDLCDNICTAGADAHCKDLELGSCLSSCFSFVAVVENTAQCATEAYNYLTCVNALTNICDLNDVTVCNSADATKCALAYCQEHPGAVECTSLSGPAE